MKKKEEHMSVKRIIYLRNTKLRQSHTFKRPPPKKKLKKYSFPNHYRIILFIIVTFQYIIDKFETKSEVFQIV